MSIMDVGILTGFKPVQKSLKKVSCAAVSKKSDLVFSFSSTCKGMDSLYALRQKIAFEFLLAKASYPYSI